MTLSVSEWDGSACLSRAATGTAQRPVMRVDDLDPKLTRYQASTWSGRRERMKTPCCVEFSRRQALDTTKACATLTRDAAVVRVRSRTPVSRPGQRVTMPVTVSARTACLLRDLELC